MKLNAAKLEEIINKAIIDVGRGRHESESFAIHENTRTQVQIIITKNKDDFHDELLSEYVDA